MNEPAHSRPNILIIMADDLGYSDIGCFGGEIPTPNLDRLAEQGLRMTQFYNCARCCPTRASLLTGLQPHRAGMAGMVEGPGTGVPGPYQGYLNDRCVTTAEVLRQAGYRTYLSGKWHVGEAREHWPDRRGFDRSWGLIGGAMNYWDITKAKNASSVRQFHDEGEPYVPGPASGDDSFYMTDATTDRAVAYLQEHARDHADKPFYLHLMYTAPHWPLHAHPDDITRHRGKYREGFDAIRNRRWQRIREMGLVDPKWNLSDPDPARKEWEAFDRAGQDDQDHTMAIYAAQVECMDRGIGKVLDELDTSGTADNTLVVFISDNGASGEGRANGHVFRPDLNGPLGSADSFRAYSRAWSNVGNTPWRLHKAWTHEGGISTPLIARWPGNIRPGTIDHQVGHVTDLMPTCCDLAGTTYPSEFQGRSITPVDGVSLLPVFEGKQRQGNRLLWWEHLGRGAIRLGDWKLVHDRSATGDNYGQPLPWELYNLAEDRTETTNLIEREPDRAHDLAGHYEEAVAEAGVRPAEPG